MIPAVIATCGSIADLPGFDPPFPFAERTGAPSAPLRNAQEAAERLVRAGRLIRPGQNSPNGGYRADLCVPQLRRCKEWTVRWRALRSRRDSKLIRDIADIMLQMLRRSARRRTRARCDCVFRARNARVV